MSGRVIVSGSRHGASPGLVESLLAALAPEVVIEGGATGVDELARRWAWQHAVDSHTYRAHWQHYGSAAGPERNARMLLCSEPDLVVAFPARDSRGTWDLIRRARAAGVKTVVVPNESSVAAGRAALEAAGVLAAAGGGR